MATTQRIKNKSRTTSSSAEAMPTTPRIKNCIPSRNPENDWSMAHATEAGMAAGPAALPPSIDLRAPWWAIGNQLDTGSCVGWATADSVLRWHFCGAGRLAATELLSPRFIWMAAKETDIFVTRPTTFIEAEGTSLKAALDIARKFGAVVETDLPFNTGKLYRASERAFYMRASQRKIASYVNLGRDVTAWKRWLAGGGGPILTRLDCDATWDAVGANGHLDTYQPATANGGHAVAFVGYRDDGRLIVRNSWGTGWGDKGFAYPTKAYAEAAFTEAYGVNL